MAKAKKAAKKAASKKAAPKKAAPKKAAPKKAAISLTAVATVHVEFTNANPGASNYRVTHNNSDARTGTSSNNESFSGVKKGDTIEVSTNSPGNTSVTVSGVNTVPTRMDAVPGQKISKFFLVV